MSHSRKYNTSGRKPPRVSPLVRGLFATSPASLYPSLEYQGIRSTQAANKGGDPRWFATARVVVSGMRHTKNYLVGVSQRVDSIRRQGVRCSDSLRHSKNPRRVELDVSARALLSVLCWLDVSARALARFGPRNFV